MLMLGMIAALAALFLLLLWAIAPKKNTKELNCIVEQSDRDESYLSYYDQYSRLHQETDGCSECIRARAEQLQGQHVKLIRVVFGRRNTGQL